MSSGCEIVIRPAQKEDCQEVLRLIQALAVYERFPNGPKLTVQELERDGFESSPERFSCFVAEDPQVSAQLCGFLLYFPVYSAWEGKAIHIEDLFVMPEFRGTGLGKRLMSRVAKVANEENCCRIQWNALAWNPACGFYKHLGADNVTESAERTLWRLYRDDVDKLGQLTP